MEIPVRKKYRHQGKWPKSNSGRTNPAPLKQRHKQSAFEKNKLPEQHIWTKVITNGKAVMVRTDELVKW